MKNSISTIKQIAAVFLGATLFMGTTSCKKDKEEEPMPEMRTATYMYDFNTGQLGQGTAYEGDHNMNLMAELMLEEREGNETRVTVKLTNTQSGLTYMVHAHDAADPNNTPNGTPYNESPNGDVCTLMIDGNGGTASKSQTAKMSFDDLRNVYEGFFVVHDPTQPISTTDLTTYLVVGVFARN